MDNFAVQLRPEHTQFLVQNSTRVAVPCDGDEVVPDQVAEPAFLRARRNPALDGMDAAVSRADKDMLQARPVPEGWRPSFPSARIRRSERHTLFSR